MEKPPENYIEACLGQVGSDESGCLVALNERQRAEIERQRNEIGNLKLEISRLRTELQDTINRSVLESKSAGKQIVSLQHQINLLLQRNADLEERKEGDEHGARAT